MKLCRLFIAAALAAATLPAVAQPTGFSYQGRLADNGDPVDGLANFRFSLWNLAAGGSQIGVDFTVTNVTVEDGLFTVEIDFGDGVFNAATRYLEVEALYPAMPGGTYETLSPRTPILTVPKAQFANESVQWKSSGFGITNASSLFVGINRDYRVGAESFAVHTPIEFGYGGMYVSTDGPNALPFYGYHTPNARAWHYLDGNSGEFRLNTGNIDRLSVSSTGRVGINSNPSPIEQLVVISDTSAIAGHVTSGTGNGVTGTTVANGSSGVLGLATGANSYGVYGESTDSSGFGGYFLGNGLFSGNVGIGSLSPPSYQFQVRHASQSSNAINFERTAPSASGSDLLELIVGIGSSPTSQIIEAQVGSDPVFRVNANGNVTADGTFTGGGADFAEMVPITDGYGTVQPGDVIVLDPTTDGAFTMSQTPRSSLVAGIYSTKPGLLGSTHDWDELARQHAGTNEHGETNALDTLTLGSMIDEIPLAVIGIVPCKVSAENGPIRPGDLLVTAALPGHAMRDENPRNGTIVGKAMGTLEQGTGIIRVLVTLQ